MNNTLKGSYIYRNNQINYDATSKGSNVYRTRNEWSVEYTTPSGSHNLPKYVFYKHSIPSGFSKQQELNTI